MAHTGCQANRDENSDILAAVDLIKPSDKPVTILSDGARPHLDSIVVDIFEAKVSAVWRRLCFFRSPF
jgi:hypothetical protein